MKKEGGIILMTLQRFVVVAGSAIIWGALGAIIFAATLAGLRKLVTGMCVEGEKILARMRNQR